MALDIGFVGLGIMGEAMARNLLKSGKFASVTVYNRTASKCDALVSEGAKTAATPAAVVAACSITFGMLSDPAAALAVVTQPDGIAAGISAGKCYVDMSTVDESTSQQISQIISQAGGRFLEGPVSGSKGPAIQGALIILAAGDEALYGECAEAFDIMGKKSLFLGDVGAGARMKLVVNMIMGSMMGAFCEGMGLAEKGGLSQGDLLEVLSLGAMACPLFALKGPSLQKREFPPQFPLKHQQKDMRLALALGDALDQPMPVAAAANECYKAAKGLGLGDNDFAAVYDAVSKKP